MLKKTIDKFDGEYSFLSNFYPCHLTYNGLSFLNSEAAYQGQKCLSRTFEFCKLNPSEAKRLGRRVAIRDDWEKVKGDIMYEICKAKFTQNPELANRLVDTGDAMLIEGNTWGDKVWGVCDGGGQNLLGKILMQIRGEFR